ncbi:seryl-tRNA synthetase [Mycoplasma haemofelis Ohio2]|uniref:Serine--tRNA ligase n=1 Tax=Mycoplasma haemofelis (strain Ohio2) TaxID=859194 RepID=F6FHS5_MYCHI|nr:seryl-tRNA synthetase [Mycoplasma haemofelis Ohio2]
MYSYKDLTTRYEEIKERLKLRGIDERELELARNACEELHRIENQIIDLNTKRNSLVKENSPENRELIKNLKAEISELTEKKQILKEKSDLLLFKLPNLPDASLKEHEEEVFSWGTKKEYSFTPLSHSELAKRNRFFDLVSGADISGSGYVVYTGEGARIFRALIRLTLDENASKGYSERYLPVLVNSDCLLGTAQLPKFEEDLFKVSDDKYLSPTSETQLVNLYRNRIVEASELPIRLTANTNCFRREAGSAGVDTAGVIRLHQFNKTEIVVFCKPEESYKWLQVMVKDACSILEKLNLPYRVLQLAQNDISFASAKTYDIEVWLPSESRYREISSVSNTLDFQAKRAKIRYKNKVLDKDEKSKFPHILNGSSLAIDRLFAALIENYQKEDGTVEIPDILRSYI